MTLFIYKAYTELKKKHPDKEDIAEADRQVDAHKANIVMEMILRFLHEDKKARDGDDDTSIELHSLLEFSRYIQAKLPLNGGEYIKKVSS